MRARQKHTILVAPLELLQEEGRVVQALRVVFMDDVCRVLLVLHTAADICWLKICSKLDYDNEYRISQNSRCCS